MAKKVGIMVPLFSLPGEHGIGDVDSLYKLVDQFKDTGIRIIQLLPMNAVSGDDTSPYSSISSFAFNPVYISLSRLKHVQEDLEPFQAEDKVDYPRVNAYKYGCLNRAYQNFREKGTPLERKQFESYCSKTEEWLEPYSVFHALSMEHKSAFWDWPEGVRSYEGGREWAGENERNVEFIRYLQWIIYTQWQDLKEYAQRYNIHFMGDLPLYVSKNSCDYWHQPELFRKGVHAGVPPDIYAEEGQDWGNPIYDWKVMKKDGFSWWKKRLLWLKEFFDLVRIDHIRGLYSYWAVPDGAKPIDVKRWTPGPKEDLIKALKSTGMELIGEDLGDIPPAVSKWMNKIDIPGYKVFLFGWGDYEADNYRFVEEYPKATLACTSTHDSESYFEFLSNLSEEKVYELAAYLGVEAGTEFTIDDLCKLSLKKLIDGPSDYVVFPLQDILSRPIRINLPGSVSEDNWSRVIKIYPEDGARLQEFSLMIEASKGS